MPKQDYVKRKIINVGRTEDTDEGEACPVCITSDDNLSKLTKHDNRTTYEKVNIDSDEGQQLAEEEDIRALPHIKDCKIYKNDDGSERQRCRTIEGWDEDDWSDLKKLSAKQEEAEEKKGKVDAETGIEEPVEPSEL